MLPTRQVRLKRRGRQVGQRSAQINQQCANQSNRTMDISGSWMPTVWGKVGSVGYGNHASRRNTRAPKGNWQSHFQVISRIGTISSKRSEIKAALPHRWMTPKPYTPTSRASKATGARRNARLSPIQQFARNWRGRLNRR